MNVKDFDYDILKKALDKVPQGFELENIVFSQNSFKINCSFDTRSYFVEKQNKALYEIQQEYYKTMKGD